MSRKKGSRMKRTSGLEPDPEGPKVPFSVDESFVKLNFKEIARNLSKKYVIWSPTESAWLRMKEESATAPVISLRKGLANALRSSFGGCFIRKMNRSENTTFDITEKKLELTQFMLKLNERPIVYSRLNDYTEDIHKYLLMAVRESYQKNGRISQKMFIGNLPTLRLCFQKITQMDASLRQYKNLLALIITANYIEDFPGRILPPNLNMLELFGNLMFDIVKFTEDAPLLILYLGIGRNYLSNVNNLRLLERFVYLYFLDLSENDFDDLNAVLEKIAKLPNLKCLSLEGNPCSVPVSYVHIVQRMCPQVDRLDGIKYTVDFPKDPAKDVYTGVLQIYGIRFFRMPKPPKEASPSYSGQKVDRFYQLEFEIPLLDPDLRYYEARAIRRLQMGFPDPEIVEPTPIKGIMTFDTSLPNPRLSVKSMGTKSSIREALKDVETGKIERSYIRWLNRDKETPTTTTLMSPKAYWAKIMHFPTPAIEIPVNQEMWRQLRDTMRSVITMRLYYKEVTYKKSNRSSVRSKKSTSSRASRRSSRKRQSKAEGGRKSMKRKSKAGGGRQSMKRKSKAGGGRQSLKRQSKAAGGKRQSKSGGKRGSIKRKMTGWSGNKRSKSKGSKGKMEEVLLVRNLIAKIPVPVEMPKWNVHFMGYTWDIKERCWARKYPGIEKVMYSESSFKSSSHKAVGGPRKSSTGKRKSRASSAGKRKSRASSAGKRKSRASAAGKRKSRASSAGKRNSHGVQRKSKAGGQRKSKMGGGKRKSTASQVGSHRKSMGGGKSTAGRRKHTHDADVFPVPKIMTCHVGVGLKREGKEAPPDKAPSDRHSQDSSKSKSSRKSRLSRKSKTERKSKMGRKSKTGGQRKSMKRASKAGKK